MKRGAFCHKFSFAPPGPPPQGGGAIFYSRQGRTHTSLRPWKLIQLFLSSLTLQFEFSPKALFCLGLNSEISNFNSRQCRHPFSKSQNNNLRWKFDVWSKLRFSDWTFTSRMTSWTRWSWRPTSMGTDKFVLKSFTIWWLRVKKSFKQFHKFVLKSFTARRLRVKIAFKQLLKFVIVKSQQLFTLQVLKQFIKFVLKSFTSWWLRVKETLKQFFEFGFSF